MPPLRARAGVRTPTPWSLAVQGVRASDLGDRWDGTAPQPHVAPGVVLGGVPGDNAHAGDVRATAATSARHPSVRNSLDPAPETTPRHAPPRTRAVAWHGGSRRDVHRQSGTTTWGTRVGRPGAGRRGRRSPGPCLGSDSAPGGAGCVGSLADRVRPHPRRARHDRDHRWLAGLRAAIRQGLPPPSQNAGSARSR